METTTDLVLEASPSEAVKKAVATPTGEVRLLRARREQIRLEAVDLESLVLPGHKVRLLMEVIERFDFSGYEDALRARGSHPGRPGIDPRMLAALWVYAYARGITAARELARRCASDNEFRWLCGGIAVNYHTLSDFRNQGELLDQLMTQLLAVYWYARGKCVAQDGVRVRASAGAGSFRRAATLNECLEKAKQRVERLRAEDPAEGTKRQVARRQRAARERVERLEKALAELPPVTAAVKVRDKKKGPKAPETPAEARARVSSTEPEARVMKMGDGGFRPAFNVQFATDTESALIVGVEVTNKGSDNGEMVPMIEQIEARTGERPAEYLVDAGYENHEQLRAAERSGVTVYQPEKLRSGHVPGEPCEGDSAEVAAWRRRMQTPEAKELYKLRAATAEWVNAQMRNHGLRQFVVRGLEKVTAVVRFMAFAQNLLTVISNPAKFAC